MSFQPLVRIWIVLAVLASVGGWTLSLLRQLNAAGYAALAVVGATLLISLRRVLVEGDWHFSWLRIQRRFARPIPLTFAGLALLVFLGGALYHPSNYDGLTYRVPRILHWLAQDQWHWIHTANYRMNDRSCGFEWLMVPVFVATHSDRFFFLINFVPFLLLPGLVFSTFSRLGVSARMSWYWMWLLPTGYNFLLQAGSIGNDAFAAVYALAAVDFALRASTSGKQADVWLSLLSAALLTGAKPGNLPLLLPWFMLFIPLVPRFCAKPLASLGVALAALLASFLPTALLNSVHCGDWTGLILEKPDIAMRHPLLGILGNSAMFVISNFTPPLFPFAGWWNHHALSFLPGKISALLLANFEGAFYNLGEIPTEEWAGIGFGLSLLLLVTLLAARFQRHDRSVSASRPLEKKGFGLPRWLVLGSPYIALLVFFAKSGMETLARLVAAYYPLLLPALLCGPRKAALVRRRWWRGLARAVMLLAFVVVILTPARPLWPVQTFFSTFAHAGWLNHPFAQRVRDVYQVYANRPDPLAKVREALPKDCRVVGFAAGCDDTEVSLWQPFGHRRVKDILARDTPSEIRSRNIHYAVVSKGFLSAQHQTLQTWLKKQRGKLVTTVSATLLVQVGPQPWHVVRFE